MYNRVYKQIMWNPTEELKSLAMKAKSFKSKLKDVDLYAQAFEKHFEMVNFPFNPEKTIQYFLEIFLSCLHLNPVDRLFDCYKRMVLWLCGDRSKKSAYYLVKTVVQLCEREFSPDKIKEKHKPHEENSKRKGETKQTNKQKQINNEREKKELNHEQKSHLKTFLNLVKKAGDKNLLDDEIYASFVEYYLERISQQVEKQILPQKSSENKTKFELGSFVLSELSLVLNNRNKQLVIPTIQRHIKNASGDNLSSYIGFFLIKQLRNFPQLMGPALSGKNKKIPYKIEIQEGFEKRIEVSSKQHPDSFIFLVNELIETLQYLIKNQSWNVIQNLHNLYFSKNLKNSDELLKRIILCLSIHGATINPEIKIKDWKKWNENFIKQHTEIIECTQINSNSSIFLNVRYVIRLFVFSILLSSEKSQESKMIPLNEGIDKIISILVSNLKPSEKVQLIEKNNENHSKSNENSKKAHKNNENIQKSNESYQFVEILVQQLKTLSKDTMKLFKIGEKQKNQGNFAKYVQKYEKWKKQILKNSTLDQNFWENVKSTLKNQQKQCSFFQEWRIALKVMFQLEAQDIENKYSRDNKDTIEKQLQYYNKQVLQALNALSLRPKVLAQIRAPKKQTLIEISQLSRICSQILDIIITIQTKENISTEIKKLMAQCFDKVNPQVIRDKLSKSFFLSRCLLMTNHSNKCKVLMDELIRLYESSSENERISFTKYFLQQMFPRVPEILLIDFCKYISSKDKLQFRMTLFEKSLTEFDEILNQDFYDATIKLAQ